MPPGGAAVQPTPLSTPLSSSSLFKPRCGGRAAWANPRPQLRRCRPAPPLSLHLGEGGGATSRPPSLLSSTDDYQRVFNAWVGRLGGGRARVRRSSAAGGGDSLWMAEQGLLPVAQATSATATAEDKGRAHEQHHDHEEEPPPFAGFAEVRAAACMHAACACCGDGLLVWGGHAHTQPRMHMHACKRPLDTRRRASLNHPHRWMARPPARAPCPPTPSPSSTTRWVAGRPCACPLTLLLVTLWQHHHTTPHAPNSHAYTQTGAEAGAQRPHPALLCPAAGPAARAPAAAARPAAHRPGH